MVNCQHLFVFLLAYRSRTIVVDLRHGFTLILMNEMNVFDQ